MARKEIEKMQGEYQKKILQTIKKKMLSASPSAKATAVILYEMTNSENCLCKLADEIFHEFRASVFDESLTKEPDGEYLLGLLSGFQGVEIW